jgi:ABC-2 type transport system permease protein
LANWAEFSPNQTQQALEAVERLDTPLSPLAWAGHGLIRIGEADWLAGLGITSLVLLGCGLIFAGALVTAEKLYYSGWASLHTVGRRKKASKRQMSQPKAKSGNALIQRWAAIPVWRIVEKDFSLLRRDVRNMSQLVTPLIIGIIYFVMLLRGGNEMASAADELPTLAGELFRSIRTYSNAGLALFVGWMLLSRLAGMGFSQEGRYYWLLKSAPVSTAQLITAKFLVAFLPVTALCWTFLLVTWLVQGQSTGTLLYTLPVVALAVAGNAGINLCFGILGANMNWEDPRQMQRGVSGCLGALATMIYLPLSLILFFGPAVVAVAFRLPEGAGQIAGLLIGSTFSLACATIPLWLVRKRVERLGEA